MSNLLPKLRNIGLSVALVSALSTNAYSKPLPETEVAQSSDVYHPSVDEHAGKFAYRGGDFCSIDLHVSVPVSDSVSMTPYVEVKSKKNLRNESEVLGGGLELELNLGKSETGNTSLFLSGGVGRNSYVGSKKMKDFNGENFDSSVDFGSGVKFNTDFLGFDSTFEFGPSYNSDFGTRWVWNWSAYF